MTAIITTDDVKAWADSKKITISSIETALHDQIAAEVFGAVSNRYSTDTWTSSTTTPTLIRRIISMFYIGYYFNRVFSTDSDVSTYGDLLLAHAQKLLDGLANGLLELQETLSAPVVTVSTSLPAIADELVDNSPVFSMNMVL